MRVPQKIADSVVNGKFYAFLIVVNVGPGLGDLGHLFDTYPEYGAKPVIVIKKRAFRCG
ncbi:hypothetical protein [Deinococcus aestuarii]|uniref:hypothetical protein n=1 Tax=Deinococcus aestuarii TaxID=2774531 RepID=UPI001C0C0976|nr:hypothetical protein [Deinococcus aestuarii]